MAELSGTVDVSSAEDIVEDTEPELRVVIADGFTVLEDAISDVMLVAILEPRKLDAGDDK